MKLIKKHKSYKVEKKLQLSQESNLDPRSIAVQCAAR